MAGCEVLPHHSIKVLPAWVTAAISRVKVMLLLKCLLLLQHLLASWLLLGLARQQPCQLLLLLPLPLVSCCRLPPICTTRE